MNGWGFLAAPAPYYTTWWLSPLGHCLLLAAPMVIWGGIMLIRGKPLSPTTSRIALAALAIAFAIGALIQIFNGNQPFDINTLEQTGECSVGCWATR